MTTASSVRDPLLPADRRPMRVLGGLVLLAVLLVLVGVYGVPALAASRHAATLDAHARLAERFVLAGGGVEVPCATAVRCWTTSAEPEQALVGVADLLAADDVRDVRLSCGVAPRPDVPAACTITGLLRGEVVTVSAQPDLAPEPPVRWIGTRVELTVLVAD
ncbi:hypothetical protein [Cellulomonas sp. KRMCY2]|uniref:hypothetical protein n=1 Tax=Cellulomonas sp. KRMCY2 TaxID=1304865 RepID=UPI00045EB571|nr:hypothetical protein [Cellulomonas sp. KRMCY2]